MKVGVIGVGNMGSKYVRLLQGGKVQGMELAALTRVKPEFTDILEGVQRENTPLFQSAEALFEAVEAGTLQLDAIIIATPHYSHEECAVRAFRNGIHVLCDKPAGVYLRQANEMNRAAEVNGRVYGMVLNQRTSPIYKRMKEIVESGQYGALKRVNWVVTDWYRPEQYYTSSAWRATWAKDGGGVLLNQCPHNLDLLQWICGMPVSVQGFCHNGRFHQIEVEDDVTAYLEWENGANGTFITSTGDAPGVNRLEITLEEAMLVCENGKLKIGEIAPEIGMKEAEYRKTSTNLFKKIKGSWREETFENPKDAYQLLLQNFADKISAETDGELIAPGCEGRNSLLLSNAIYLSSWQHRMVQLPEAGTEEERQFEETFETLLKEKSME